MMLNSSLFYEISVLRPFAGEDSSGRFRHGSGVRGGAPDAEIPGQLHSDPGGRNPADVDPARVHRRQFVQILTRSAENFARSRFFIYLVCSCNGQRFPVVGIGQNSDGKFCASV